MPHIVFYVVLNLISKSIISIDTKFGYEWNEILTRPKHTHYERYALRWTNQKWCRRNKISILCSSINLINLSTINMSPTAINYGKKIISTQQKIPIFSQFFSLNSFINQQFINIRVLEVYFCSDKKKYIILVGKLEQDHQLAFMIQ